MNKAYSTLRGAIVLILTPLLALAPLGWLTAAPAVPDAGLILQEFKLLLPQRPSLGEAKLKIEQQDIFAWPQSKPFLVGTILIKGNTVFDSATLLALVSDARGQMLTLQQASDLAARITAYYKSKSYPLVRAIIPAQTITSGVITLEVIEARYGSIRLINSSRVKEALLKSTLSTLKSDDLIKQSSIDHVLMMLSDIPGVMVSGTLSPGEKTGTSDLLVTITPGRAFSGNVIIDNYGNRYTGRERVGAALNIFNWQHLGDTFSMNALSSGSGMKFWSLGYEVQLHGMATRLGGSYSLFDYTLGEPFTSLKTHGTGYTGSLWIKQCLMRGRAVNLYGQIQYDRVHLRDHVDLIDSQKDRILESWTASLSGYARDVLLRRGVFTWSLSCTAGRVDIDGTEALLYDQATAQTQGGFYKLNANIANLQALTSSSAVYFSCSSQWANTNLDSSQKMNIGGPYSVRAYDIGSGSGDSGYFISGEFRQDLGCRWQALAFLDNGMITINKKSWTPGKNSTVLSGTGIGLNWSGKDSWNVKGYLATPIGSKPEDGENTNSARIWLNVSRRF
jgi:hemolysin activation/secretion protein